MEAVTTVQVRNIKTGKVLEIGGAAARDASSLAAQGFELVSPNDISNAVKPKKSVKPAVEVDEIVDEEEVAQGNEIKMTVSNALATNTIKRKYTKRA
jgi:uncharacterized UPF0146 family protein